MSAFELLLLEQLPEIGPVTVRRLVRLFGDPGSALHVSDRRFAQAVGVAGGGEAARARRDPVLRRTVDDSLRRAEAVGMTVLTWTDEAYPDALHHLADPPPVLFLWGRTELLDRRPSVAVVGARRSTERGRDVAGRLGAALGRAGVPVVSGLALGVDGAAHAGALRTEGDTIAVLGAGADVPYPRFHLRLHDTIRERGLLVSEFPPGTRPAPHHFPRRNRILAALADVVVVVEAGGRSGALITVDHALDLGREVWSVPGPIDTKVCAGSNRLLADGARPLVSIDAFVDAFAAVRAGPAPPRGVVDDPTGDRPKRAAVPVDGLARGESAFGKATHGVNGPSGRSPAGRGDQLSLLPPPAVPNGAALEGQILEALREAPAAADELAHRFGRPIATILAVLTTLELHGEVERLAGMRFRRAA